MVVGRGRVSQNERASKKTRKLAGGGGGENRRAEAGAGAGAGVGAGLHFAQSLYCLAAARWGAGVGPDGGQAVAERLLGLWQRSGREWQRVAATDTDRQNTGRSSSSTSSTTTQLDAANAFSMPCLTQPGLLLVAPLPSLPLDPNPNPSHPSTPSYPTRTK